jgi:hypothetical protein
MLGKGRLRACFGIIVTFWLLNASISLSRESGYQPVRVPDGGSVRGVVRVSGDASDITVATGKDEKICGGKVSLARLSTGLNGGVKNAVVYIQGIRKGKPFSGTRNYLLDQKGCRYIPHVMILPFGSPLEIVNSDPVLHNVHISELGSSRISILNIAQPIRGQRSTIPGSKIRTPGFLEATCDAGHPWMNAYIVVAEHPYYAITDVDGNFVINDIPPGEYRLLMWHEGVRVVKVDVDRGRTVRYEYEDPYVIERHVTIQKGRSTRANFEFHLR